MNFRSEQKAADAVPASIEQFTETRWSRVMLAGRGDSDLSQQALAALCTRYWFPIYSFIRRKGSSAHDAQDLTQQFFARLLETNALANADRTKGRFRNFLLGAVLIFFPTRAEKNGPRSAVEAKARSRSI
jgi:hypothetical protein